jgi:predicted ATPase
MVPVRPFVHELVRSGQTTTVELSPFSGAELRAQVTAILDAAPEPDLVEQLLLRSEGNPFLAEELLASTRAGSALPESVRDALLWRLDGKSEATQHVLRIVAVAGGTIEHDLLERSPASKRTS